MTIIDNAKDLGQEIYTKAEVDANKVAKVTSTDNAIVRFDGTSGAIQNSGVLITDSSNLLVGTATDNGVDKLQVNGSVSATSFRIGAQTSGSGTTATHTGLALTRAGMFKLASAGAFHCQALIAATWYDTGDYGATILHQSGYSTTVSAAVNPSNGTLTLTLTRSVEAWVITQIA